MNDKEIKEKAEELLDVLEKDLMQHVKGLMKASTGVELKSEDVEVILAKLGKRYLLKVLSKTN